MSSMNDTDTEIDNILVELVRFVEVYHPDEDISEADRQGINEARQQLAALVARREALARIDELQHVDGKARWSGEEVFTTVTGRIGSLKAERQRLTELTGGNDG